MEIIDLKIKELNIPFKISFNHASANRNKTQSVLVEAHASCGAIGYGESCPRSYVTQETLTSVFRFFEHAKADLVSSIKAYVDLQKWSQEHQTIIDHNPAAWCAIELALLDVISKVHQQSLEATLGLPEVRGTFQYSAVLGDSATGVFRAQFEKYWSLGFRDYKVKLSGDLEKDQQKISILRQKPYSLLQVRGDANNLWQDSMEVIRYIKALDYPFFAIEEPLAVGQYPDLLTIHKALRMKMILDESFLKWSDFSHIEPSPEVWIINLRVSKMGGLLRSKKIADGAKKRGIPLIVGAQVGESSLLTRAALAIANHSRDCVIAQEGAFGTHLLEHDVCARPLMFQKGGAFDSTGLPPKRHGLGIEVLV